MTAYYETQWAETMLSNARAAVDSDELPPHFERTIRLAASYLSEALTARDAGDTDYANDCDATATALGAGADAILLIHMGNAVIAAALEATKEN